VLPIAFRDRTGWLAVGHLGVTHFICAVEQTEGAHCFILDDLLSFLRGSLAEGGWVPVQLRAPANLQLFDSHPKFLHWPEPL
jgi:hypothetical protein